MGCGDVWSPSEPSDGSFIVSIWKPAGESVRCQFLSLFNQQEKTKSLHKRPEKSDPRAAFLKRFWSLKLISGKYSNGVIHLIWREVKVELRWAGISSKLHLLFFSDDVVLPSFCPLVVLFMSQVSTEPLEYNDCINKHVSSRITCVSATNKEHSGCSEQHYPLIAAAPFARLIACMSVYLSGDSGLLVFILPAPPWTPALFWVRWVVSKREALMPQNHIYFSLSILGMA